MCLVDYDSESAPTVLLTDFIEDRLHDIQLGPRACDEHFGRRGDLDIGLNERGELVKGWPGGFFEEGLEEMFS